MLPQKEFQECDMEAQSYDGTKTYYPRSTTECPNPQITKFANPAPLGLCAFALTTFVLSLINIQARDVKTPNIVVGLGIISLIHTFLIHSFCLWRSCPICCGNVGVCVRKYIRRGSLYVVRFVLDQLRINIHSFMQYCCRL